jgi:hypothetical protein
VFKRNILVIKRLTSVFCWFLNWVSHLLHSHLFVWTCSLTSISIVHSILKDSQLSLLRWRFKVGVVIHGRINCVLSTLLCIRWSWHLLLCLILFWRSLSLVAWLSTHKVICSVLPLPLSCFFLSHNMALRLYVWTSEVSHRISPSNFQPIVVLHILLRISDFRCSCMVVWRNIYIG